MVERQDTSGTENDVRQSEVHRLYEVGLSQFGSRDCPTEKQIALLLKRGVTSFIGKNRFFVTGLIQNMIEDGKVTNKQRSLLYCLHTLFPDGMSDEFLDLNIESLEVEVQKRESEIIKEFPIGTVIQLEGAQKTVVSYSDNRQYDYHTYNCNLNGVGRKSLRISELLGVTKTGEVNTSIAFIPRIEQTVLERVDTLLRQEITGDCLLDLFTARSAVIKAVIPPLKRAILVGKVDPTAIAITDIDNLIQKKLAALKERQ